VGWIDVTFEGHPEAGDINPAVRGGATDLLPKRWFFSDLQWNPFQVRKSEIMLQYRFQSLRVRLLLPLLAVALFASVGVAIASYWLGGRWERDHVSARYRGIESTLRAATFPLNQQVITSIADLTETDLITLDSRGLVLQSSLGLQRGTEVQSLNLAWRQAIGNHLLAFGSQEYRYGAFELRVPMLDGTRWVAVLFNESELRAARWRMASLPLLTGLSTVILLTSVTLLFAGRLVGRLSTLQHRVRQIAEGEFAADVPRGANDEVGLLGTAVTQMSRQLLQLRATLQRQQGEKLLHQVAGGLAHQLRNSITGAKMAVELHQQGCDATDDSLAVALTQLEHTESHVRRLLTVASGRQDVDQPEQALSCLQDSMRTLEATAKHLGVSLEATLSPDLVDRFVRDGPSLQAAFSNLVLNAMHEGSRVTVQCSVQQGSRAMLTVTDDGDGPADEVVDEIFEPFVTSKPEGLGLGLPLVARCARRLGGEVRWERRDGHTCFSILFQVTSEPS